jgi:hypothetical protein
MAPPCNFDDALVDGKPDAGAAAGTWFRKTLENFKDLHGSSHIETHAAIVKDPILCLRPERLVFRRPSPLQRDDGRSDV